MKDFLSELFTMLLFHAFVRMVILLVVHSLRVIFASSELFLLCLDEWPTYPPARLDKIFAWPTAARRLSHLRLRTSTITSILPFSLREIA